MATVAPNLEWAKQYVAGLNDEQLRLLTQMYEKHRLEKEAKEKEQAAEQLKEKERVQQQAILDLLTSQKPVTVDVVRSSTSPESFTSGDSASGDITVKEVLLGKVKSSYCATSPRSDIKPYKPRGSRERVLFDEHLFTFDKLSYDCKKKFFRCERKNTCAARIHTPIDSDRVIHKAQAHNHPAPTPHDLTNYDIDFEKVRHGHVLHVNPIQNRTIVTSSAPYSAPSSILTPKSEKSDYEEENFLPKIDLTSLLSGIKEEESTVYDDIDKKPVKLHIPDNFNCASDTDGRRMELALTKYLIQQTELRKELLAREGDLPVMFPESPKDKLTVFVAHLADDIFHMVEVKDRNEISIREALQQHFKKETTRPLQVSISSRINIPLPQQMIDEWKTEEFLRVDISRPHGWKLVRLTKVE